MLGRFCGLGVNAIDTLWVRGDALSTMRRGPGEPESVALKADHAE